MSNSTAYIPSRADKTFPICFAVVLLITLVQIIRVLRLSCLDKRKAGRTLTDVDSCSCQVNPILTMHLLILIVCILQIMLEMYYVNLWPSLPSYGIPILGALPFIFMFWIFTTLIFQWATIVQFPFDDVTRAKRRMRPLLFLANFIVLVEEILYIYFAVYHPNEPVLDAYNIFDNSMMSFLYLVTGIAFLVYGSILSAQLQTAKRATTFRVYICSVTARIQLTALLIFILFMGESVIWILRIPKYKHTTWIEITSFNFASLCVILALFWKSVSSMEKDLERSKNSSRSQGTNHPRSSMPMTRLGIGGGGGGGGGGIGISKSGKDGYLSINTPRSTAGPSELTPRSTMPTLSIGGMRDSEAFTDGIQHQSTVDGGVPGGGGETTPPHLVLHPDPRITFGSFPESSSMDVPIRHVDHQELHGDL